MTRKSSTKSYWIWAQKRWFYGMLPQNFINDGLYDHGRFGPIGKSFLPFFTSAHPQPPLPPPSRQHLSFASGPSITEFLSYSIPPFLNLQMSQTIYLIKSSSHNVVQHVHGSQNTIRFYLRPLLYLIKITINHSLKLLRHLLYSTYYNNHVYRR